MRYYLPDEDKLFKKIQKIPIEHHKKEELSEPPRVYTRGI
jgi:hypothetical protein